MSHAPDNSTAGPNKPETKGPNSWEWQQLANAIEGRFGQDSVLWSIIGAFSAMNAVLLVALGATGKWPKPDLICLVCGTGLLVSILWLIMQSAALRRVEHYEYIMENLEELLRIPPNLRLLYNGDGEAPSPGKKRRLPRARSTMPYAPITAMVAWMVGFLIGLYKLLESANLI